MMLNVYIFALVYAKTVKKSKNADDDKKIVCYNEDDQKGAGHMKKVIPVLIAVVLIIVIAGIGFGAKLIDKYSYSDERADLQEYFGNTGEDDVPIILQNERIEAHARIWDGICYFDLDTVYAYFNDRFYEDKEEDLLLYTMPDSIIRTEIGSSTYRTDEGEPKDTGYVLSRY